MRNSPAHAPLTGARVAGTSKRCNFDVPRPCRSSVREEYMPAMRLALTAPMWGAAHGGREKDGIPQVMAMMNDYSLTRCVAHAVALTRAGSHATRRDAARSDDWEALLDMTKIKARLSRASALQRSV